MSGARRRPARRDLTRSTDAENEAAPRQVEAPPAPLVRVPGSAEKNGTCDDEPFPEKYVAVRRGRARPAPPSSNGARSRDRDVDERVAARGPTRTRARGQTSRSRSADEPPGDVQPEAVGLAGRRRRGWRRSERRRARRRARAGRPPPPPRKLRQSIDRYHLSAAERQHEQRESERPRSTAAPRARLGSRSCRPVHRRRGLLRVRRQPNRAVDRAPRTRPTEHGDDGEQPGRDRSPRRPGPRCQRGQHRQRNTTMPKSAAPVLVVPKKAERPDAEAPEYRRRSRSARSAYGRDVVPRAERYPGIVGRRGARADYQPRVSSSCSGRATRSRCRPSARRARPRRARGRPRRGSASSPRRSPSRAARGRPT